MTRATDYASVFLVRVCGSFHSGMDLFSAARDAGYKFYRIPALLRLLLPDGTPRLLAFAEGRQQIFDHGRVDIVLKRSVDDGATWSALTVVHTESNATHAATIGNPTPLWDPSTGEVLLFLCRGNAELLSMRSADAGSTWSAPEPLSGWSRPPEWTWVAVGPPAALRLRSGRYVLPCDGYLGHARFYQATSVFSFVIYSDDRGATWRQGPLLEGGNECQASALRNGSLLLNMRSREVRRLQSYSHDGGESWSAPAPARPAVSDGNCQGSQIALGDGSVLVATSTTMGRVSLHAHASANGGASWDRLAAPIVDGSGAGYSALVELPTAPTVPPDGDGADGDGTGGGSGGGSGGSGGDDDDASPLAVRPSSSPPLSPSPSPSATVGLLYEAKVPPATTDAVGKRRGPAVLVLRYTTLQVPLREPLPPAPPLLVDQGGEDKPTGFPPQLRDEL